MNPARREPLLWLQLLGLAALPLECLLLMLVLAGADPGPIPAVERLLTWLIGAVAPAVLFWQLPPDLWSLLLLQVPLRGRRPDQFRLSALQTALPLRLLAAAGAAPLLPLLWWIDTHAGLAWPWSPLAASPRIIVLLLAMPLLALLQWQWTQLVQALWMLSRSPDLVQQTLPLSQAQAAEQRLNVGLPLLLLPPLDPAGAADIAPPEPATTPAPAATPAAAPNQPAEPSQPAKAESQTQAESEAEAQNAATSPETDATLIAETALEIEPEVAAELETATEPAEPAFEAEPAQEPESAPEAAEAEAAASTDPTSEEVAEEATEPASEQPAASEQPSKQASALDAAVTVEPEQPTEEQQGAHLDS